MEDEIVDTAAVVAEILDAAAVEAEIVGAAAVEAEIGLQQSGCTSKVSSMYIF